MGLSTETYSHGIATSYLKHLLGEKELGRKWAESLRKRMNMVKRKGTKQARFIKMIHITKKEFETPLDMVVNMDKTGANLVLYRSVPWLLKVPDKSALQT